MKSWLVALSCGCFVLLGRSASAIPITYVATLTGANEAPPNASTAFGTITVIADDIAGTLNVLETFVGLSTPATAAHLHCCAPAGVNAPVVVPFAGFPNANNGTYSNAFTLVPSTFFTGLQAGNAYANIHDSAFPGGEIRGQLAPAVPEPATLTLLGTGLLALARRRFVKTA